MRPSKPRPDRVRRPQLGPRPRYRRHHSLGGRGYGLRRHRGPGPGFGGWVRRDPVGSATTASIESAAAVRVRVGRSQWGDRPRRSSSAGDSKVTAVTDERHHRPARPTDDREVDGVGGESERKGRRRLEAKQLSSSGGCVRARVGMMERRH